MNVRGSVFTCALLTFLSPVLRAEDISVSETRIAESVKYLSSDEREGRGIGTDGLQQAGEYLAEQFADMGLKTDLIDGGPFQNFELPSRGKLGDPEKNRLVFTVPVKIKDGEAQDDSAAQPQQEPIPFKRGEDYQPMLIGGSGVGNGALAFAGYGITAEDLEYDDYADLDVAGKVVVIIRREPRQQTPDSVFDGVRPSRHARFDRKIENARRHGAAALILVNDTITVSTSARRQTDQALQFAGELAELELSDKTDDETLVKKRRLAESLRALIQSRERGFDQIPGLTGMGGNVGKGEMPVFYAARQPIDRILKAYLGKGLEQLEQEIDSDMKPHSAVLAECQVDCSVDIVQEKNPVRNVMAVLEGKGPLANETIVIGAHYDHLGRGGIGSLAPWTRSIHNGADDNASGTALLLEVARNLASRETPPARRILFIAFTGEERGLLGSKHYIRNPVISLDDTVAMFNLDMVGRLTDNKLEVNGVGTAKEFEPLVDSLNEKYKFDLTKKPSGYGPSDHASFYGAKVPVLHLFTNLHSDYHRPSDDFDKLNLTGMRRIGEMLVDIVDRTAGKPARPNYVEIRRGGRRR